MAYTPIATLFSTTPLDGADTPGYSAGTKAYGFTEVLTSARLNRLPYALALNIDDVNTRLINLIFQHNLEVGELQDADVVLDGRIDVLDGRLDVLEPLVATNGVRLDSFESGGLDAAYRLGVVNTPGGGRLITADGGAVEITLDHASLFQHDVANAALRLRSDQLADEDGAVLLDMVSGEPPAPGDTIISMIHRQEFSGGIGASFTPGSAATLNPGGASASTLRLTAGTTGFPNTHIFHTHDLVEISGGSNPGLYFVESVTSATDLRLATLDGAFATFTADENVTATLYRSRILGGLTNTLVLQEDPNLPQDVLYLRSRSQSLIRGVVGNGAGTEVFEVDFNGNLSAQDITATGDFKYSSGVTKVIVPTLHTLESASANVLGRKVRHGWDLSMDAGFVSQETVYFLFDLPIPEGAVIDTFKIGMGKINSAGGTVLMEVTSLVQATLNMNAIGHGSNVNNPTAASIAFRNIVADQFELAFEQQKASTMASINAAHSKENYYWVQITFEGLESFTNIRVNNPEITYTYDVL